MIDLYIDGEWQLNQNIFLMGYAYSKSDSGQLYEKTWTKGQWIKLMKPVTGSIYFYGPDIGMIEKYFNMEIRQKYRCINLIKLFKDCMPNEPSYKLEAMEEKFGIYRKTKRYKENIFKIFHDWYRPWCRKEILKYNRDDVINMMLIKKQVFREYNITQAYLESIRLK